jgi:hypothetical protein
VNKSELEVRLSTAQTRWEFWEVRARVAEARVRELETALATHKRTSVYPDAADGFLWDVYLGTNRFSKGER